MTTEMCQHLIEASTVNTPMVLVHTDAASAFTCPTCTVAWIEAMLEVMDPRVIVESIHLDRCDHSAGICFPCCEALKAAISARFAVLAPVDKTSANRLLRIKNKLTLRYRTKIEAEQAKPLPAYRNARILGRAGERGRAGQRWTADRAQRLSTLRPPVEATVVIPA
jgi:hypothetical protein